MFTNWLTSSSPSTSSSSVNAMGALPPTAAAIIATPPDIILEVGPPNAPSARFVAHSIILAMHSGYLRSAIRLDENGVPNSDLPIFLTNVTPEQFSPLLTYMYTGYLDLNIENIFGVLLATHVLHMPRALEICRNFLSRMQSEGYLSGTFLSHMNEINNDSSSSSTNKYTTTTTTNLSSMNSVKVIRPIASKPAISNFGFIVPPMPHISLPSTGTPFRSLNNQNKLSSSPPLSSLSPSSSSIMIKSSSELQKSPDISTSPSPIIQSSNHHRSLSLVKSPITTKDLTIKRSTKLKRASSSDKSKRSDQSHQSQLQQQQQQKQQQQSQVPTTSSSSLNHHHPPRKESIDNENKIIIDVASCDGPVRFRRVLNDAYGKQPQTIDLIHAHSQERSHQSVSYSFHQQMAKNISQQRQQNSEESENSQDSSTKQHHHSHSHSHNHHHNHNHNQSTNNSNTSTTGEVYNCVYCKHTFKSQYCYQKHAKRHLNPLSLESSNDTPSGICSNGSGTTTIPAIINHSSSSSSLISTAAAPTSLSDATIITSNSAANNNTTTSSSNTTTTTINNMNSNNTSRNNIISSSPSSSSLDNKDDNKYLNRSSLDLKREVRPLDMNVQYYPCKTCGSKFPSYYFVHKHRKMCHANEDN